MSGLYTSIVNTSQSRAKAEANATIETQKGAVTRVYTNANGTYAADVLVAGQIQSLIQVENSTGNNLRAGDQVTVNNTKGKNHNPQIIGYGSSGTGTNALAAASAQSAAITAAANLASIQPPILENTSFLLEAASTEVKGFVLDPGANVYFATTPESVTSGGVSDGSLTITAVPLVLFSLPDPATTKLFHNTIVDLIDSYETSMGMYRLDAINKIWIRRDVGGGSSLLLPATTTQLGGIKVGSGLSVTPDGTLSSTGSAGGGVILVPSLPSPTSGNRGQMYLLEGVAPAPGTTTKLAVPASMTSTGPATACVAAFQFNEGTGTSTQEAANSQTGTLQTGMSWTTGDAGYCLLGASSNNGVLFPDTDLVLGSNPREFMIRFKTASAPLGVLFSMGPATGDGQINIYTESNFLKINNGSTIVTGTTDVVDNNWHTAFFTFDGTTWTIYLDGSGTAEASGTFTTITASNTNACIGGYELVLGNYPFIGSYDFFYAFNRQLTSGERSNLYTNPYSIFETLGTSDTLYISIQTLSGNVMQQIILP